MMIDPFNVTLFSLPLANERIPQSPKVLACSVFIKYVYVESDILINLLV